MQALPWALPTALCRTDTSNPPRHAPVQAPGCRRGTVSWYYWWWRMLGVGFILPQHLHGLFQPWRAGGIPPRPWEPCATCVYPAPQGCWASRLGGLPSPSFFLFLFCFSFPLPKSQSYLFFFPPQVQVEVEQQEGGTANPSCRPGAQRLGRRENPAKGRG